MVKPVDPNPSEELIQQAKDMAEMQKFAVSQDFEIWKNKRPCLQIMQVPTDGAFHKIRAWYRQFYNPRSMTADILAKCEGTFPIRGAERLPVDFSYLEQVMDEETIKFTAKEAA